MVRIEDLKANTGQLEGIPKNPRTIKNKQFKDLVRSILVFPKMLYVRPITHSDMVILGGNQRKEALAEILEMGISGIIHFLRESDEYQRKPDQDKEFIHDFWNEFTRTHKVPAQDVSTMSLDEKIEFVIKDNIGFGEHDMNVLDLEWDHLKLNLKDWGVDVKAWKEEKTPEPESGNERNPFQQMTFTLSESQIEVVKKKLSAAKRSNAFKETEFDNTNANANALYFLLKNL